MKTRFGTTAVSFLLAFGISPQAADRVASGEYPFALACELGNSEFAAGDSIRIREVRGSQNAFAAGASYVVTGSYTLASQPEAELSLFLTTTNPVPTPIDPRQTVRVQKGTGTFTLTTTLREFGYPHLSFYPASGGSSFGGVYFGQGQWVLRTESAHQHHQSAALSQSQTELSPETFPPQNRAILDYLGPPVAAPASLDQAYTRDGLMAGIQLASRNAGIALKRLEIEDSEFPFLVGIICAEKDYPKLVEQFKRSEVYEERGGVSTGTCHSMNIIPWRVFPSDCSQRIGRRLLLREQMFFDKLTKLE